MRPLILVVDDEAEQRFYFECALTRNGYRVLLAENGASGLRTASSERPVLVILDINMPGMDGVSCFNIFRQTPATRSIPVLLMTALPLPSGVIGLVRSGLGGVPVFRKQDGLGALLALVSSAIKEKSPSPKLEEAAPIISDERRFCRDGREVAIDFIARAISIDGRNLPKLATRRFDLFVALLETAEVVSRERLLARIWGGIDNPNLVDVTVLRLRKDLRKFPALRIKAERGGYLLVLRGSSGCS